MGLADGKRASQVKFLQCRCRIESEFSSAVALDTNLVALLEPPSVVGRIAVFCRDTCVPDRVAPRVAALAQFPAVCV